MARLLLFAPLLVLITFAWSATAHGHGQGLPWIWLERQEVQPGERFPVLVVDFTPSSEVSLELVAGERREQLGAITSATDGHGEGELQVPADFPDGYAELYARDAAGQEAVTLLGVGDTGDELPPAQPGSPTAAPVWQDPSVVTLGGLLGAALLAVGYMLFKRRSASQPASARKPAAADMAPPPRRVPSKTRRARRH